MLVVGNGEPSRYCPVSSEVKRLAHYFLAHGPLLGTRFQIGFFADKDPTIHVVDVLALHLCRCETLLTVLAHNVHSSIGWRGRFCPCLHTVIGRARRYCGHASEWYTLDELNI